MYHSLDDLSPNMAQALIRMHTDVVLIDGGLEKHKIHKLTLRALVRHRLVEHGRDKRARPSWKPSAQGLKVIATEAPRLLAARSQRGYTTVPALAMSDEPEAVSDVWLVKFQKDSEQTALASSQRTWYTERLQLERVISSMEGMTDSRAVRQHLRVMRQKIRAIDRELKAA